MKRLFCVISMTIAYVTLFAQNWTTYKIGNIFTINMPSTMELRDNNSIVGSSFNEGVKILTMQYDEKKSDGKFVFQPVGLNSTDIEKVMKANDKYARVIVNVNRQNELTQKMIGALSTSELKEIEKSWRKEPDNLWKNDTDYKWYPMERKQYDGKYAIVTKYQRPAAIGGDSPVYVEEYKFFMTGKQITITISYRTSCASIYKTDFSKIMDTVKF